MSRLEPVTSPESVPAREGQERISLSSAGGPAGMLFAQVVLRAPAARGILLATPTASAGTAPIARALASLAVTVGHRVHLVDLTGAGAVGRSPDGVETTAPAAPQLLSIDSARQVLMTPGNFTVAFGGGVLDTPATLIAAAVMDGVIVVVRQGRTTRRALDLAREELERVGAHVLGAVLQD